jgi:hypothetical protein
MSCVGEMIDMVYESKGRDEDILPPKIFNIFVNIFLTINLLQYNVQYANEIITCNFYMMKDSRGCATTKFLAISDSLRQSEIV